MTAADKKAARDWEAIERDYRSGQFTDRELGEKYGITHAAVQKWAKREGWQKASAPRRASAPAIAAVERSPESRAGFIYVIYQDCEDRIYKIGMSAALESRLKAHQCGSPYELRIACAYFVPDMRAEEAVLHAMFQASQVRGEWFRLSVADLRLIAARSLLEAA